MKRRLKNRRPKAAFGIDGAIQAAATIQSAIMNAAAQAQAASTQADAIASQARTQANALEQQSINNERLKTKELELTRETNNKIADSISTLNLNESMTQGKLSNEELARENRISMKRGGSVERKRRRLSNQRLAGDDNLPFQILDGGGAKFLGVTPYGNLLYELYGDDHNHYHKAQGGKYKSGVGIKTADGVVFEGEGNQNGGVGEMLLVNRYDPSNVMALSRHQVGNINPVQSILAGMSPEEAAIRQEANKGNYNPLLEYGYAKYGGPVRRRLRRGGRCKMYPGGNPTDPPTSFTIRYGNNAYTIPITDTIISNDDLFSEYLTEVPVEHRGNLYRGYINLFNGYNRGTGPTATALSDNNDNELSMTFTDFDSDADLNTDTPIDMGTDEGIQKALNLQFVNNTAPNTEIKLREPDINIRTSPPPANSADNDSSVNRFWETPLAGAIYNAGSQLTSAGINAIGNYIGARKLSNAYNNAARTMTNAYNSLRTIDDDRFLNEDSWDIATRTPAVRFTGYNINPQKADVDRALMNQNIAIRNNTNSGAARLARMSILNNTAQEQRSKLYAEQANREEEIKQKNLEALNKAAAENMQARNQHRLTLANAKLDLAKYNNDIANERIMGAANAQSQMGINSASAKANALTSTAQGFGTALNNSAQGFSNALNTMYNTERNFMNTLYGATPENQANTLLLAQAQGQYINPSVVDAVIRTIEGSNPALAERLKIAYKIS